MHLRSPLSGFVLALSGALLAAAAGTRVEYASRVVEGAALRGVKDSGVCETTPGVNQLSGYIDVGTNMSMVRNDSARGAMVVEGCACSVVLVL